MLGVQTVFYDDPLYQEPHKMAASICLMYSGGASPSVLESVMRLKASEVESVSQRLLMTPDEVLRMGPREQVCFISGKRLNPIAGQRQPYYERQDLVGSYLPNPNHPPYDRIVLPQRRMLSRTLKVWSHEVLPHLAHLPQYQQGMMSYAAKKPLMAPAKAAVSRIGRFPGHWAGERLPSP